MDFIIFSLNKWSKIVFFLEKHDYYLVFRPFFIPLSVARSTSHPIYSARNWDILTQELTGQYNASASTRLLLDQGNYVNDGMSAKGTLSYYDYLWAHLSQRSLRYYNFY